MDALTRGNGSMLELFEEDVMQRMDNVKCLRNTERRFILAAIPSWD